MRTVSPLRGAAASIALALVFVLAHATVASAKQDWFGWLEEFSGPGPFRTHSKQKQILTVLGTATMCFTERIKQDTTVLPPKPGDSVPTVGTLFKNAMGLSRVKDDAAGTTDEIAPHWVLGTPIDVRVKGCVYFDGMHLNAEPDPVRGFPAVAAHLYEFGGSFPLGPIVDVGAGVGFVMFNFDQSGINDSWNLTATPVRMSFKPIHVIWGLRRFKRAGALKFVLKETFVFPNRKNPNPFGQVGPDGNPPLVPFTNEGELVRTWAIQVDALELFCRGNAEDKRGLRGLLSSCRGPR